MLTLHTTEGFAAWFQGLDDAEAEEVAAGIALVEALGPEREPDGSSELVLWYQCPVEDVPSDLGFRRRMEAFPVFAARVRGVLRRLESASVRRRLAEAPDAVARRVFETLLRIADHASWRRMYVDDHERAWEEVQTLSRAVFASLGLRESAAQPLDGLRELRFGSRTPGLRVLYGLDAGRARGLLILGESLDRSVYGPSVRRALALWQEFLDGSLETGERLDARSSR